MWSWLSSAASAAGTPNYVSPEQIRDSKSVDVRADVFALGAILYEIATQKLAYDGEDLLDIFNRIDRGEHLPVEAARPELPERRVAAIEGALRSDRSRRIPSCERLLEEWSAGVPDAQVRAAPLPATTVEWMRSMTLVPASSDPGPGRPSGDGGAGSGIRSGTMSDLLDDPAPPPVAASPASAARVEAAPRSPPQAAPPPAREGLGPGQSSWRLRWSWAAPGWAPWASRPVAPG